MLKIGITGGIGSGKTTVCKVFETLGVPVFYADVVAKQLMTTDEVLKHGLKNTFGAESYTPAGALNRKHIAALVFNDTVALQKLNALVHPAVFRAFDKWLKNVAPTTAYVLKEAALLFESGSYQACDKTIIVTAPLQLKLARVMHRDSLTEKEVLARMDKQLGDQQKIKMANYSLANTEQLSVIVQVLNLHQQFLALK